MKTIYFVLMFLAFSPSVFAGSNQVEILTTLKTVTMTSSDFKNTDPIVLAPKLCDANQYRTMIKLNSKNQLVFKAGPSLTSIKEIPFSIGDGEWPADAKGNYSDYIPLSTHAAYLYMSRAQGYDATDAASGPQDFALFEPVMQGSNTIGNMAYIITCSDKLAPNEKVLSAKWVGDAQSQLFKIGNLNLTAFGKFILTVEKKPGEIEDRVVQFDFVPFIRRP